MALPRFGFRAAPVATTEDGVTNERRYRAEVERAFQAGDAAITQIEGRLKDIVPPPTVPAFATTAEARAGVVTDKVMSPALVQARSGRQLIAVAGQGFVPFNQIPNEATEIDVILNGVTFVANAGLFFDFEGAPNGRAFSTRSAFLGATVVNTVGDDNLTVFNLDFNNAITGLAGMLHLVRDNPGGTWGVSGTLRRASNFLLSYGGVFNMNGDLNARLRLGSQAALTSGVATAVWRI